MFNWAEISRGATRLSHFSWMDWPGAISSLPFSIPGDGLQRVHVLTGTDLFGGKQRQGEYTPSALITSTSSPRG